MQIKEILLFSHPKSVFPLVFSLCTSAPKHLMHRCEWRPFDDDGEFKLLCGMGQDVFLCLCHTPVNEIDPNAFLIRHLINVQDTTTVRQLSKSMPLGSLWAWHTQHSSKRKPNCFTCDNNPREAWLWKKSLERRGSDSTLRTPRSLRFLRSFLSTIMKFGLHTTSSCRHRVL